MLVSLALVYVAAVISSWHVSIVNSAAAAVPWYPYDVDSWASGEEGDTQQICRKGHMQSPVELPLCQAPLERPALDLSWGSHPIELMNNGHTVQLTLVDSEVSGVLPGEMSVEGSNEIYKLIQCHFHWGSEHTIGGQQQDMSAHCVHLKQAKGRELRFGVLGIFYEVGDHEDPFLRLFDEHLPSTPHSEEKVISTFKGPVNFDMAHYGLNLSHYWTYPGSLTTPPCTEAVNWYLVQDKKVMTKEQYDKFKSAIGHANAGGNFRPPQLMHGRQVIGCLWGPRLPQVNTKMADWYPYDQKTWSDSVGTSSNPICSKGHFQSPVELPFCEKPVSRPKINLKYGTHPVELMNNGHTVQLTLQDDLQYVDGVMLANGATYKLLQCHFHWGSEHTIGDEQQKMVAHCVHVKSAQGRELRFGVLAIFYEVGDIADPFLDSFIEYLPNARQSTEDHRRLRAGLAISNFTGPVNFDLAFQGLDLTHYWTYPGSLTTPPCTEAVDWYPLMHKQVMTQAQYDKFKGAIGWDGEGGNYRPPQLLHGRVVAGCAGQGNDTTKVVAETLEDDPAEIIVAVVIVVVFAAMFICVFGSCMANRVRAAQQELDNALPPGMPSNRPIIIRRFTKDGQIDEWEDTSSQERHEKVVDSKGVAGWKVKESGISSFINQISASPKSRSEKGMLQEGLVPSIVGSSTPSQMPTNDQVGSKTSASMSGRYLPPQTLAREGQRFNFLGLSCWFPFLGEARNPALADTPSPQSLGDAGRSRNSKEDAQLGASRRPSPLVELGTCGVDSSHGNDSMFGA